MATDPYLLSADMTYVNKVVTVTYSWDGALPTDGPVSLITSVSPRNDPGRVRRFGIKWVDGSQNAIYVFDDSKRPMNEYVAGSKTEGNGTLRVQFADALRELGTELVWSAVICTDHDLQPVVTGDLAL